MGRIIVVIAVMLAATIIPTTVFAQACGLDLRYDPRSVASVSGTVIASINYFPIDSALGQQSIVISSANQRYNVVVGPGWYVSRIGLDPRRGDVISVTGSALNVSGQLFLIASRVTVGGKSYVLRDARGVPAWSDLLMVRPPEQRREGWFSIYEFSTPKSVTFDGDIRTTYLVSTGLGCPPLVAAVLIPLGSHPDYTTVILGPESYLEQRGITLKSGDHLWVRGLSAKSIDVYPTVLATSIAQGSNVVGLRTVAGLPLWPSTAQ